MLLRAVIPAGYMPSAANDGLLFEFCPENVPVRFMQMLAGDHDDHGHNQHHADGNDNHHCPVGHLLSSVFAVGDQVPFAAPPLTPEFAAVPCYFGVNATPRKFYDPRGPPA